MKRSDSKGARVVGPGVGDGEAAFAVRTRIGRAVGKAGRYACDHVRALPGAKRDQVVLEATDGHQATCVLGPGTMSGSQLVPANVLPTRQLRQAVTVRRMNGQWQSSEGRLADAGDAPGTFPPVADVLPVISPRPYYETARHAEQRRAAASQSKGAEAAESMHVVTGIDVALLAKLADGLGASKLTLFIPVPIRRRHDRRSPAQVCADKAIAVCPAERPDGDGGVGVVMPTQPDQTAADYMKARQIVVEAERRNAATRQRGRG